MALDPQAQALLDMVYRIGAPRFHELDVHQARHSFEKLQFALRPLAPAVASVTDVPIPGVQGGAVLMARLYRPISAGPDDVLPIAFYFHGGGWCVGNIPSYDVLCRELARLSGCMVVSLDYRLAPEHRFPTAHNDAWDALQWLAQHAASLGADPQRLAVGGDSAGGTLAAACALQARDAGLALALQLLFYPGTTAHQDTPSHQRYAHGLVLESPAIDWFFDLYIPERAQREDWRFAPLRAPEHEGVAPAWLGLAEYDPLVDEGVAYADCLRAAGVAVDLEIYRGVTHEFIKMGRVLPEARQAHQHAARALRHAFALE